MTGHSSENVDNNNEYKAAQVAISSERLKINNRVRDRRVFLDKYSELIDVYFNYFKICIPQYEVFASECEYPIVIKRDWDDSIGVMKGGLEYHLGYKCAWRCRGEPKPTFLETIIGDFFNSFGSSNYERIRSNFEEHEVCNTKEEFVDYLKHEFRANEINERIRKLIRIGVIDKKNTSKKSILKSFAMAPLAKYIHPMDPIMSMAYLERCNIKAGKKVDKEKLKTGFQDEADLFRSVISVEGLRIAEYLEPDIYKREKVELPMLDEHFKKIKSGLLIPELNSLIGKARTDKMVQRDCFSELFRFKRYERVNYSTVATEMIFFEESDLELRKAEVKKYRLDMRLVESDIKDYISGVKFSSLSHLLKKCRSFHWGNDW